MSWSRRGPRVASLKRGGSLQCWADHGGRTVNGNKSITASLVVLFGCLGLAARGETPPDVPVAVHVGSTQVRLSVRSGFSRGARGLPRPGEVAIEDEHDRAHGAHTYCYRYRKDGQYVLLALHDSLTFGLYSATLSWVGRSDHGQCPLVAVEPEVVVGSVRYRLSSTAWAAPEGFGVNRTAASTTIAREWTVAAEALLNEQRACSSRVITVKIEHPEGRTKSLWVQNWEEPGC